MIILINYSIYFKKIGFFLFFFKKKKAQWLFALLLCVDPLLLSGDETNSIRRLCRTCVQHLKEQTEEVKLNYISLLPISFSFSFN